MNREPGFVEARLTLVIGPGGASLRPYPRREGTPTSLTPGTIYDVDGYTDQGQPVPEHPIVAEQARWYHLADGSGWIHASGGSVTSAGEGHDHAHEHPHDVHDHHHHPHAHPHRPGATHHHPF